MREEQLTADGKIFIIQHRHDSIMICEQLAPGIKMPLREIPMSRSKYMPVTNQIKPKGETKNV
jgi:hypothetical protein